MKNQLYIFLTIAFISLTLFLGSWGLTETSEARYAIIAKEMLINKDFINPTSLGIKHFHKPPVTYYLTMLGYKIFGINEFGARFFMQLALIFQLLLVFKITLILYKKEKIAFAASLIYFSLPIVFISVRSLTTDAYLTTFVLASIYFWLQYKLQQKKYFLYLFYLFLGIIFETKGPVGFVVPVTFIITYKLVYKDKIETTIHQLLGFLLFLLVSASWYIVVINKNVGLADYFFNDQLVDRVSKDKFERGELFYYYILLFPLVTIPWLFYLIPYFKGTIKSFFSEKKNEFVLLIIFLVLFLILTISTSKLILYILPATFIVAVFSAKYLSTCNSKKIKTLSVFYLVLVFLITISMVIISLINGYFNLNSTYAIVTLILFGSVSFFLYSKIKNNNFLKPAYFGVLFMIALIISGNHLFSHNESLIRSTKPIAEFILKNTSEKPKVLVYNSFAPSLAFYLDQEITTIKHYTFTTHRETFFEETDTWKENLIDYYDENDRLRILKVDTTKPTFLVKRRKDSIPETLQIFINRFKNKKEFVKYEVYY